MNWINVAVVLMMAHKEFMASPTPLKLPGHTQRLTPYIKHWEAANFDRAHLHDAHQKHIEQKHHRRKRDLNAGEYGPAHTIRLNFFAHDREFRLVLRQDPLSVFASDVQIENTLGPMDYDISRIYTGSLEDDENSHVHAILTHDNLLDGTIETSTEHYYVEPSHRYSRNLPRSGVHSIVYKVSDVNTKPNSNAASTTSEHCASERLRRSMLHQRSDVLQREHNISSTEAQTFSRRKRWLPDEFSASGNVHQDPPLPLDLDVPYNDDITIFTHNINHGGNSGSDNDDDKTKTENNQQERNKVHQSSVITWRNAAGSSSDNAGAESKRDRFTPSPMATSTTITTKSIRNRNIIVNNYNPNIADDGGISNNNNNNNIVRKTYTKHKNIIVSTYNINNNNNNNSSHPMHNDQQDANLSDSSDNNSSHNTNYANNFFNTNWTTMFVGGNDRPSHKTHVEIITKNGATKKPNIIVNNYNPEIMMAPNPHNPNFNSMLMTNLLSGRGQDSNHDTSAGGVSGSSRSMYDRKITCMLYLQADHTFFQKMGSDEASIEAITRHVQRANSIYKNTDFNNDGKPDNITFMIKRIKVHNMNAVKDPAYRFPGNYGVEKFLELFSEEDYDAFCLAYMFTYRDFEMGTLGLAWTGDLKNAGGVCEKNGHYRGSLKSLNTGIVTLLNYGKHVPPAVSHVTLAHEIGHNFGSPHDPEQCTPGGEDGNYIMFARATSGDKKNNNKFSPCSLKSIEPVLNAKARSTKGCFTEPQTSICGNGVVETGEQCDCGWEEDCKDLCCFPMSRHPRIDEKPCTLTPRSMCSPSQGPCCTTDCNLKFGDKCRDDNGCRDPSFCDGRMPQCPPSVNKPNKTICNKEFVCYMGDCTGSICLAYGLESCQCIPGPNDDKIKSCELCCKLPGESNPCRSSFEWNESPFDVPDMYAKPGTPCNDYNGYCDVFQKCREVDPSGPLATLRKLLLSEESIATFKKWIQHNWYTVALAAIGVFVLLILSTKLLAKRSNLKLKSVTIIHSATTETVRLPDDNNGVIVHTAVRTKVPFKKKVRGERSNKIKNSNNNGGNNSKSKTSGNGAMKSGVKSMYNYSRGSKVTSPTTATVTTAAVLAEASAEVKKPARSKKNRIAGANLGAQTTTAVAAVGVTAANVNEKFGSSDSKKAKKFKKHSNKEIIDYSSRNAQATAVSAVAAHTNAFGKVQKWLLESPIVTQPLSHIEHSSKVRKVMSKSQSTPERLVQKSPQKTKSMGNLSNEKVKLQVVYKPPFKFSLRLSKSTKVKTHVIGGSGGGSNAVNKLKRQSRNVPGGTDNKRSNNNQFSEGSKSSNGEKTKRAALLLLSNNDNGDNQILTLNEPNYETLNSNSVSKLENPFYENMQYTLGDNEGEGRLISNGGEHSSDKASAAAIIANKISRSSSKTNLEVAATLQSQSQRQYSYSRSNSLSGNNPFAVSVPPNRNSRKLSETNSQTNLSRNFGSTQNLINSSQSNLAKSKKRSSLNLKSSVSKNGKDPPPPNLQQTKRSSSSSNMHLRRDSSLSNLPGQKPLQEGNNYSSTTAAAASPSAKQHHSYHQQPLRRSSSSMAHQTHLQQLSTTAVSTAATAAANSASISSQQQLPPYNAKCSARASFSNIPRAILNSNNTPANINNNSISTFSSNRQSPASATVTAANFNTNSSHGSGSSNNTHADHRHSRSGATPPSSKIPATTSSSAQRSNSIRQHAHNYHPPPLPYPGSTVDIERELPSDLEVMVSDVENLVS